jgi:GAF domain-containing protein
MRFLSQENIRLREENDLLREEVKDLRRYIRALQSFQQTVQHFTPEQEVLALLDQTLYCAMTLLNADDGSLLLINEETDELVFALVHGIVRDMALGRGFDRRLGIAGWVAEHGEPAIIDDVHADPRFLPDLDEVFGFVTVSLVAVPLVVRGKVLGVIEVVNKGSGEPFTEDDASLLSVLATLSASALDYANSTPAKAEERR